MTTVRKNILKEIYQPRSSKVRKYDFGLLLIIGGSEFYSGSPALAGLAAFRSGVDMVRIFAPQRAADIISSFSPNLAAYPLAGKELTEKHLGTLRKMTESAERVARGKVALVIGGGLGRTRNTQKAIIKYLSRIFLPTVIDADAIYALAGKPAVFRKKNFLFTPHSYEFFILTGKEVMGKREKEKIKLVKSEAARLEITILLKGKTDIISNGREVVLNKTGSSYQTKGGCGDTLAGIAGALMARGIEVFKAAQAAAYLNGRAGELAGREKKEGLLATDLIEALPGALKV